MTTHARGAVTEQSGPAPDALPHRRILVALDASDHAGTAMQDAAELAGLAEGAQITGVHVYAARLHDRRFRQMEGGLPEQFRAEAELERQRHVHDDLIARGLSIITDSYLDQAEAVCRARGIEFRRCSLEGKNYRELVREANSGAYDLLVLGSIGLGATGGSRLGTVCRRTARRSRLDTLVVKEAGGSIRRGPIVVAVDGSAKAYGGLLTGLRLARRWQVPVKVVAAFDPYFHYVAFNRIAGVLSEQAGKVFRFKEQEKLHEEIIDSGLAKIYEGHLAVARSIAAEHGVAIETELLSGKPHDAIGEYVGRAKPSLLVLGKTGIHADEELDIGGNAEQLLENVACAVLLGVREHQPALEVVSGVTTTWTREAQARMERVPSFVRNMARMAILRYAQERGHTVITQGLVEEATARLMPGHAQQAMGEIVAAWQAGELKREPAAEGLMRWSEQAKALLLAVGDLAVRGNLAMRAEKKARQDKATVVEERHVRAFLDAGARDAAAAAQPASGAPGLHWDVAALARLMRVPEGFMRERCRQTVERFARENGCAEITLEVAERGLALARAEMEKRMRESGVPGPAGAGGGCPFGFGRKAQARGDAQDSGGEAGS